MGQKCSELCKGGTPLPFHMNVKQEQLAASIMIRGSQSISCWGYHTRVLREAGFPRLALWGMFCSLKRETWSEKCYEAGSSRALCEMFTSGDLRKPRLLSKACKTGPLLKEPIIGRCMLGRTPGVHLRCGWVLQGLNSQALFLRDHVITSGTSQTPLLRHATRWSSLPPGV